MKKKIFIVLLLIIIIIVICLFLPRFFNKNPQKKNNSYNIITLDKGLSLKEKDIYKKGERLSVEEIIEKINDMVIKDYYKDYYNSEELDKEALNDFNDLIAENPDIIGSFISSKENYISIYKIEKIKSKLEEEYFKRVTDEKAVRKYFDDNYGVYTIESLKIPLIMAGENNDDDTASRKAAEQVLEDIKNSGNILDRMQYYSSLYYSDLKEVDFLNENIPEYIKTNLIFIENNTLYPDLIVWNDHFYIMYRISRTNNMNFDYSSVYDYMFEHEFKEKESAYYHRAFKYLRDKYNMKVNDEKLRLEMNKYINQKVMVEMG